MNDKEKRDAAVDDFAAAIKARLDEKASEGYAGWDGAYADFQLALEMLDDAALVRSRVGRPLTLVDIGARAMMLHYRLTK